MFIWLTVYIIHFEYIFVHHSCFLLICAHCIMIPNIHIAIRLLGSAGDFLVWGTPPNTSQLASGEATAGGCARLLCEW